MCGGGVQGGDDARVVTGSGAQARAPLPAINSPFNDWVVMHNKQSAYCTCVATARVPRGTVARALFWDTADPYYYVRRQEVPGAGYDLLVVGGEDHKTGEATDPEAHLRCPKEWTRAHFPGAKEFEYRWSGQVLEPNDGLAFAGRNPLDADNVFVITGDSGHGMTYGTLGARLVADLVQGRANPWARLYDPGRVTVARESALEFVRENASVVAEYTELLTGGDVASVDEIPAGQGAVLRRSLTKVVVHKDAEGRAHECSAICPHLGCLVHRNGLEKSWDCSCHGSRFTALGEWLAGPANTSLVPA